MKPRRAPWIAVTILIVLIAFFLGTRYGQEVSRANKVSDEVTRLIPTYFPTPKPTQTPSLTEYIMAKDPTSCNIRFLVEKTWDTQKLSTQSATVKQNDQEVLSYSCAQKNPFAQMITSTDPSRTTLGQMPVDVYKVKTSEGESYIILATTGRPTLFVRMSPAVFPLFEQSFAPVAK
jgi:hypothetical protein